MVKSLAWGYGIAGAVVAAAVIVVAGSTVGLTAGADGGDAVSPAASTEALPSTLGEGVISSEVVTTASGEQVEYVYVDQPASRGDHDEDDDDHGDDHGEDDDEDDDEDHDDDEDDD